MRARRLRLILGDQLNSAHSWFERCDEDTLYVLMEVRQETDYVLHHAQKILAIFAAMRRFGQQLEAAGHRVRYLQISDPENRQDLCANLDSLIERHSCQRLEYQAPDEWRLDRQLAEYVEQLGISSAMCSSEHFYAERAEVGEFFASRKSWLMESFYRHMRKRHGILIDDQQQPVGGQWNYDHDNRQSWKGEPAEPADRRPTHDHSQLWQEIAAAGVDSFGNPQAAEFRWPLDRQQALDQLKDFVKRVLPSFGRYQDAASAAHWRLFHSLISFALNVKMLSPAEVIGAVVSAYRAKQAPIASVEGFIRQILGWREYVRGVYWAQMPDYVEHNHFDHQLDLPSWFWDGDTRMNCLHKSIGQSLENAYAHHIQRLMIIGNFALLAGLDPAQVHRWYLGIYIDAFEWVELPNTLGMSQFADGGLLATKPYVSSAAYINRMSDYCKGCHYHHKQRTGERACPYNALYWDFHQRHRDRLEGNPRIGMVYRNLNRMDAQTLSALADQAARIRGNVDRL